MSATEMIRRKRKAATPEHAGRRILRLREVERRTGRKSSSIYEGIAAGTFPKPVPLGLRAVGWLEDEVEAWIDGRVAMRDRATNER